MSAEEWEELKLEAEKENQDREFEDGRVYTEEEKHLLIRHYTKIFNKTALTLGTLHTVFKFLATAMLTYNAMIIRKAWRQHGGHANYIRKRSEADYISRRFQFAFCCNLPLQIIMVIDIFRAVWGAGASPDGRAKFPHVALFDHGLRRNCGTSTGCCPVGPTE